MEADCLLRSTNFVFLARTNSEIMNSSATCDLLPRMLLCKRYLSNSVSWCSPRSCINQSAVCLFGLPLLSLFTGICVCSAVYIYTQTHTDYLLLLFHLRYKHTSVRRMTGLQGTSTFSKHLSTADKAEVRLCRRRCVS